ncbi:methyltransferase domain-containing protein [Candidatus Woesearchaeota archaeon]|jgi:ubiquinone/menaquinone biosynthesis C-methylase UbiE|nr:methyltransferase domain-containing protein [Candidatus Woesearchaeota archaeon]
MTYYDQISAGYEELHREEQEKKIKIIKQVVNIHENDLVLDVGCGPYYGGFECKIIGLDPSIELLKQAKIPVVLGIAEKLPFADNTFNKVISLTAIQNFDDIKEGLLEMKRVSKESCIFTFLKKSKNSQTISELINLYFNVNKIIEEEKDFIYFVFV